MLVGAFVAGLIGLRFCRIVLLSPTIGRDRKAGDLSIVRLANGWVVNGEYVAIGKPGAPSSCGSGSTRAPSFRPARSSGYRGPNWAS